MLLVISIHAPARGATPCTNWNVAQKEISIHAPARGATITSLSSEKAIQNFNPRSREGSDGFCRCNGRNKCISIHAPARGATSVDRFLSPIWKFQSTLPRGERRQCLSRDIFIQRFQSTLPRGERRLRVISAFPCNTISIHAPARGAT